MCYVTIQPIDFNDGDNNNVKFILDMIRLTKGYDK